MNAIIEKYGITQPEMVFLSVKTYDDLIKANVAFLEGKVEATPYHHGPVDPETAPLLEDLIFLNKKGFLSVNGQPALIEKGVVPSQCEDSEEKCEQKWYLAEQKSYLEGYVKLEEVPILINFLLSKPDIFFVVVGPDGIIGDTFPEGRYILTRDKVSKDEDKLNSTRWREYSVINTKNTKYLPFDNWYNYPNIQDIIKKHTRLFFISTKEYGKGSVEKILLEFYELQTKGRKGGRYRGHHTLKKCRSKNACWSK